MHLFGRKTTGFKAGLGGRSVGLAGLLAASLVVLPAIAETDLGGNLMGAIEGPTTITDPSQYPTEFNEAPELAALVESGELPPVEERLPVPEDVLVIQPLDSVGTYSDKPIRRAFTGPGDWAAAGRLNRDSILFSNYDQTDVGPGVAKSIEGSDDGTVWTLTLREGMKWSDGHPFTADDFVFFYEHIVKHPELGNSQTPIISVGGELGAIEKIDEVTVQYTLPAPNFVFPELLAGHNAMTAPWTWGRRNGGGFAPAHYLEQFHPAFADEAELEAMAAEAGFVSWSEMFTARNDGTLNPDLPVVTPWKSTMAANENVWVLERNPYFYAVDTEGNQLPYLNEVVHTLIKDIEAINFEALSGEIDFQGRHMDIAKLPLFLENQEAGDYKVHLDPLGTGSIALIAFNMSYDADECVADLIANVDFRRALALGIEREQINQTFLLGLATSGSIVPAPENPYFPGPEYRDLWATHQPAEANAMLDEIGLTEKDAEGYRLCPDGQPLNLSVAAVSGSFVDYPGIGEMVRQHWADIGIDLAVEQMDRTLFTARNASNENQMVLWNNGNSDRLYAGAPLNVFPSNGDSFMGPHWGAWFASGGEAGIKPSVPMQKVMSMWRGAFTEPSAEERVEIGKEIWTIMADQVWNIGLVGVTPAGNGMRVTKTGLLNTPERQVNNVDAMTPGISRPETFYWAE